MTSQRKVAFRGATGEKLAAVLELPDGGEPAGWAVFAHCFTCTKDIFSARHMTAGLARRGFGVMRFDFTGLGESEGDFAAANFSSNVRDLVCAADFMREADGTDAPVLMVGHSLGGAAVLAAAGEVPEVRAVATVGAPAEPAHVAHLFTGAENEIREKGEAEVLLAGRPFKIRRQFLDDIEGAKLAGKIRGLNRALLIFHSAADATVDIGNARKIFEAARHPKSFVSLDRADHLLSDKRDAAYVSEVLAAWAGRYLPRTAAAAAAEESGEADAVAVSFAGGRLAQKIQIGKHELVADEPSSLGGGNAGPTPYGYLLAALGSCTAMTLRMYARRKGWPLDDAVVTLRHAKVHAEDCESCESESGGGGSGNGNGNGSGSGNGSGGRKIDRMDRDIVLRGKLTDEQRERLLEIADKCPVHRTLESEIQIRTTLSPESGNPIPPVGG